MNRMMLTALVTGAAASAASAQLCFSLSNLSFENDWNVSHPNCGYPLNCNWPLGIRGGGVLGFSNNGDPSARLHNNSDGAPLAHEGTKSIRIDDVGGGAFHGYTTDTTNNFCPFSFLFFDVPMEWGGTNGGPIEITYWYQTTGMMNFPTPGWPADQADPFAWPQGFAPGAVKMEVKGAGNGNQNNGGFDAWSMGFAKNLYSRYTLLSGTTGGWVKKRAWWPARTPDGQGWKDQTESGSIPNPNAEPPYPGYSLPAPGTWPNPTTPGMRWPDRIKITIGRWNPSNTGATGSLFVDDMAYTQYHTQCNNADIGGQGGIFGPDGQLDNNDFVVFINLFFAQDIVADVGKQGGIYGHDVQWDNNDFVVFINLFFSACDAI